MNNYNYKKIIADEKIQLLNNVSEILKPKKLDSSGIVIKTKNFRYPLIYSDLAKETATTIEIKKGDILLSDTFSGEQKFYLISEPPKSKISASTFLVVIRPKTISPEYLFLYLQNDTAKKYFLANKSGGFFPRIPLSKLSEMPIIIPDIATQEKSESLFNNLFLKPKVNILNNINKELFSKTKVAKPFQKEFLEEELNKLRLYKKEILNSVIKEDFSELRKAKAEHLYKSFLILSGSILEAYLLDWLCEVDKEDYFSDDQREIKLYNIINRLYESKVIDKKIKDVANNIREKRNNVHPKKYFNNSEKITAEVCDEIIDGLRIIFEERKI